LQNGGEIENNKESGLIDTKGVTGIWPKERNKGKRKKE
jgi:hypothetical protein